MDDRVRDHPRPKARSDSSIPPPPVPTSLLFADDRPDRGRRLIAAVELKEAADGTTLSTLRNPYAANEGGSPTPLPRDSNKPARELISERIRELADWRGERLAEVRALIHEADPEVVEEWKWRGVPIWSHDGIVCTGESYKQHLKLTFPKGAALTDPGKVFNAELGGKAWRAFDIHENDRLDGAGFRALIREAVAYNRDHPPKRRR